MTSAVLANTPQGPSAPAARLPHTLQAALHRACVARLGRTVGARGRRCACIVPPARWLLPTKRPAINVLAATAVASATPLVHVALQVTFPSKGMSVQYAVLVGFPPRALQVATHAKQGSLPSSDQRFAPNARLGRIPCLSRNHAYSASLDHTRHRMPPLATCAKGARCLEVALFVATIARQESTPTPKRATFASPVPAEVLARQVL